MANTAHGEYLFGNYPQSAVQELSLITHLRMIADAQNAWQIRSKKLIFADIMHSGEKYRGIFRPDVQKTSWFRFEPIRWNILEQNDRTMLLHSAAILDAQRFNRDVVSEYIADDGFYYYRGTKPAEERKWHSPAEKAADYANIFLFSDLKYWLENDFLSSAFNADEAGRILTEIREDHALGEWQKHSHKVFLLSEQEIYAPAYRTQVLGRFKHATPYAKAIGCKNGAWWTETACDDCGVEAYSGILVRTVKRLLKESATLTEKATALAGVVPVIRISK
ncbi:MAG: hypothetical protein IK130_03270 [Oscillospiraceae bacterium]|nr:hypothetical protein [Oscillospiraceae bacterium]